MLYPFYDYLAIYLSYFHNMFLIIILRSSYDHLTICLSSPYYHITEIL